MNRSTQDVFCSCCGWEIGSDPIWTNGGPVCAECWDYCRGSDECTLTARSTTGT